MGILMLKYLLDDFIKIWVSRNLTVIFVVIYLIWLGLGSLYGYKDYRSNSYYPAKIVLMKTKETTLSVEGIAKPNLLKRYLRKTKFYRSIKLKFITTSEKYKQLNLVLSVGNVNPNTDDFLDIIDIVNGNKEKTIVNPNDKTVKLTLPLQKNKNSFLISSRGKMKIGIISYELK
jgi:hypothetical protein